MSNEIPVWVTITRINGQIFPQVFGGIHEITDNEFVVGTEWIYVSRRQSNMGETFRVRNTMVLHRVNKILVEAEEIDNR